MMNVKMVAPCVTQWASQHRRRWSYGLAKPALQSKLGAMLVAGSMHCSANAGKSYGGRALFLLLILIELSKWLLGPASPQQVRRLPQPHIATVASSWCAHLSFTSLKLVVSFPSWLEPSLQLPCGPHKLLTLANPPCAGQPE